MHGVGYKFEAAWKIKQGRGRYLEETKGRRCQCPRVKPRSCTFCHSVEDMWQFRLDVLNRRDINRVYSSWQGVAFTQAAAPSLRNHPSLLSQQQPLGTSGDGHTVRSRSWKNLSSFFNPLASCQCLLLAEPNRKVVDKRTCEIWFRDSAQKNRAQ